MYGSGSNATSGRSNAATGGLAFECPCPDSKECVSSDSHALAYWACSGACVDGARDRRLRKSGFLWLFMDGCSNAYNSASDFANCGTSSGMMLVYESILWNHALRIANFMPRVMRYVPRLLHTEATYTTSHRAFPSPFAFHNTHDGNPKP